MKDLPVSELTIPDLSIFEYESAIKVLKAYHNKHPNEIDSYLIEWLNTDLSILEDSLSETFSKGW